MAVGLVLATLIIAALIGAAFVVAARPLRALLERQLGGVEERLDRRLGDLDARVDRRLESLDGRLLSTERSAGRTATEIVDRLGKLDGTAAQMLQRANDLSLLEQALRAPKARGGFGELMLANLLRDCLPAESYALQHTFRTGERVDAVVRVDQLVPVDAKFPLDNFQRLVECNDEAERELHEKAFARDVKHHVDAIASKYILPAEGTYDFAFMYLPSEAVYYELVCGKTGKLYEYARMKRVFPVSPTTFHAYLQVIVLGLKGLQIERHAQDVMSYCAQLNTEFGRFRDEFAVLGKHLGNAQSKFAESDRRLLRFETSLERAAEWDDSVEPVEVAELPRAIDAA